MNILAIDPANRTGWSWSDGKQLRCDVWLLGSDPAGRLQRLEAYIQTAMRRWPTNVIAYEEATFGSRHAHVMRRHNELAGVIQLCAAKHNIPCWSYPPTQWKAMALGSGHADKNTVRRLLKLLYGIDLEDEDAADAVGILKAAERGRPPERCKHRRRRGRRATKQSPPLF